MRSDETLLLQALKLKQLGHGSGDLVDHLLQEDPEATQVKMRNICAFISPELFQDVGQICDILRLSKRRFVEMALIDLSDKANKILEETQALKPFEVA